MFSPVVALAAKNISAIAEFARTTWRKLSARLCCPSFRTGETSCKRAEQRQKSLTSLSADGNGGGSASGRKYGPRRLVEAHLERIAHLNPQTQCVCTHRLRGSAAASQRRPMPPWSPAKQLDRCTECRSPSRAPSMLRAGRAVAVLACAPIMWRNMIAPLVSRLRARERFCWENQCAGIPYGIRDGQSAYGAYEQSVGPERTPGGSSGGEAAAIAARCSAGGVGSDGGGSIRVPAHYSGICGLKPTPGRIPATGHFPESAGPFASLGVVGPMARTVARCEVAFRGDGGPGFGDPMSAPVLLQCSAE